MIKIGIFASSNAPEATLPCCRLFLRTSLARSLLCPLLYKSGAARPRPRHREVHGGETKAARNEGPRCAPRIGRGGATRRAGIVEAALGQGNHSLPLRLVVYARSSAAMDGSGLREAEGARATGGFRLSRIGGAASIGADGQKQGARAWLSVPASARRTCQDACDPGGTRRLGNAFSGGEGPLSVVVLDAEASAE